MRLDQIALKLISSSLQCFMKSHLKHFLSACSLHHIHIWLNYHVSPFWISLEVTISHDCSYPSLALFTNVKHCRLRLVPSHFFSTCVQKQRFIPTCFHDRGDSPLASAVRKWLTTRPGIGSCEGFGAVRISWWVHVVGYTPFILGKF